MLGLREILIGVGYLAIFVILPVIVASIIWEYRHTIRNMPTLHWIKRYSGHYDWMKECMSKITIARVMFPNKGTEYQIQPMTWYQKQKSLTKVWLVAIEYNADGTQYALCYADLVIRWTVGKIQGDNHDFHGWPTSFFAEMQDSHGKITEVKGCTQDEVIEKILDIASNYECVHQLSEARKSTFSSDALERFHHATGTPNSPTLELLGKVIDGAGCTQIRRNSDPDFKKMYS